VVVASDRVPNKLRIVRDAGTQDDPPHAGTTRPGSLGLIPGCALVCEGLLDRLPVALLLVDEAGTIRSANDFACRLLRRDRAQLEMHPIACALVPLERLVASIGRGEARVCVRGLDGAAIELAYACSQVSSSPTGGYGPYAVIVRAATSLESEDMHRLASVGAAVPAMVHRAKNSLVAVTMGLELLDQVADDAGIDSAIHATLGEAHDLVMSLDGFGALGRPLRTTTSNDPARVLEDARLRLGERADRAGVRLTWLVDRLPPMRLEPSVIHALLVNLVCHAFRLCDAGAQVRVQAELIERGLRVQVEDDGAHDLAEASPRGEMSLCQQVIEAAGGTLEFGTTSQGTHTRMVILGDIFSRPRAAGRGRPS
jgi:signal transduction histidine kinase